MKSFALVATLLSAALSAQPQDTKKDCEVTLSARMDTVLSGQDLQLVLKIHVYKDMDLDATVLAGYDLETKIDGKDGPKLANKVRGKVKIAAGTKIERTIKIPCKQVFPEGVPAGMARVTFAWPKFIGTGATLTLAPDMSTIKLAQLDLAKTTVTLVTNYGNMTIKFRHDKAPKTVENFIKLAKDGFYNGTRFHRVIRGFMIQGGCPNTKEGATGSPGSGSPGYKIDAEFNDIRHVRGTLSMARGGDPNSAGSQFFVVHAPARHLDGKYTAFGELESGFETLDKIATARCAGETPVKPVHLKMAIVNAAFKAKK